MSALPTLHSRQTVLSGEPVFAGHFPGHPILPGVMLFALARDALTPLFGRTPRLARIVRQRFLRPVLPGTELAVECVVSAADDECRRVACRWLLPDGTLAARGEFLVA